MAIGGAMEQENPEILREFIRRAGGAAARIVILPQASSLPETGQEYVDGFHSLGVDHAAALEFRQRSAAGTPEQIELLRQATGIFIAGGDQLRLSVLYGGTALEAELLAAYHRGCLVGGTSAGAAILSKTMIANGQGGPTPREGIVQFAPGLGFTDKFTFDQHFRQRDRLGRLAYAVAAHPGLLGIGLDENTAAIVEEDAFITVWGSGGVTIVDGREITGSDLPEIEKGGPVAISNLKIHFLTHGCTYDRLNRQATIPAKTLLVE
jgi:cyanophycinase